MHWEIRIQDVDQAVVKVNGMELLLTASTAAAAFDRVAITEKEAENK